MENIILKTNTIPGRDQILKLYENVGWTAYTKDPDLLGRAEGGTAILAYQSTIPEGIEVDDQGQGSRLAYIGLGLIALAILSLILRKTKPNKVKAAS